MKEELIALLRGGGAHLTVEKALEGIDPEKRNVPPAEGIPSVWEELEHMRLDQEDVLRYMLQPGWESPPWPDGYWPAPGTEMTEEMWNATLGGFFADLEKTIDFVRNAPGDLCAPIPHAPKHSYLRTILTIADHNAYHLGQLVRTRKALGDWKA